MTATPWAGHEAQTPEVIKFQPGDTPATVEKDMQVRRMYIRQADLGEFGYTRGCKRCEHIIMHGPNKGTMPHSAECRAHIMAKLEKTDHGRARIEKLTARENRFLMEHACRHEEADVPAAQGRKEEDSVGPAGPEPDGHAEMPPFD